MSEFNLGGASPSSNDQFSNHTLALSSSNGSTRGQGRDLADVSIINVFEALGGRIAEKTRGRHEVFGSCLQPERHKRGDLEPSFHMNERKGVWTCELCGGGGILTLVVFAGKASNEKGAAAWLREHGLLATSERSNGRLAPARPRAEQRPSPPVDPRIRPSTVPPHAVLVAQYPYASIDGSAALKTRWEWAAEGQDYPAKSLRWYHVGKDGFYYWGLPDGWKLGLYGEDRVREIAQAGGTVYLCEGEKCCDALNVALVDAVATTTPDKALLPEHLDGMSGARRIVVLPDADDPGRKRASEHTAQLRARYEDVRLLDLYEDLGDGSDVADWLANGGTIEQLRDLIESVPIVEPSAVIVADPEDGEPEWPDESQAPWPVMGETAYHGLLGELIAEIEAQTEACREALLFTALAFAGNAFGNTSYAKVHGAHHPPRLNVLLVGETAEGKGVSEDTMEPVFHSADAEWLQAVRRSGYVSGEAIIADVSGELEGAPAPDLPYAKSRLVIEEEFATVLSINKRDGATTSQLFRSAWDGKPLVLVRSKQMLRADEHHISVYGHITPQEYVSKLSENDACGGFINRFLNVSVRSSKALPSGGHIPSSTITKYATRLRAAISFAREGGVMRRTPEAEQLWGKLYVPPTKISPIADKILARWKAQKLRLSVAYCLLDESRRIDVQHVLAAEAAWGYVVASVTRIFGYGLTDDERKLLAELRRVRRDMTAREIDRLFTGNRSARERELMVGRLVARGLAVTTKLPTKKPSLLVRAVSLEEYGKDGKDGKGITTPFSQHFSDGRITEMIGDRSPEAEPDGSASALIRNPSSENVPEKPYNHPFSVKSVFSVAVETVSEDVNAVSDTEQANTAPDGLASVTGVSETEGEIL